MASRTLALRDAVSPAAGVALAAPFVRVEVYADAAPILDAWRELEAQAPCSVYQTSAFLLPWVDTLGRKAGLEPRFVLARDRDRRPAALLCLGLSRCGPVRVASWLGGKDSNFAMPLLRRPGAWREGDLRRLLREAARACDGARPDVFVLANQPLTWDGHDNPFASLPRTASPSFAYGTALADTAAALFESKLSKDARKKLRKKEAKLGGFGAVSHRIVSGHDEQKRVLDAFFAQKIARFRARGIVSEFDSPEMRRFLEKASAPLGSGIELHALVAGDRIVAVYGGGVHGGQWSGMVNSFDGDEDIARTSPGDLLLMKVVESCCARGIRRLDLGIGEASYKEALCDETIPLFDVVFPLTVRGRAYALAARLGLAAKRRIKRAPLLLAGLNRLRAAARG